jgi:hypothetical protein
MGFVLFALRLCRFDLSEERRIAYHAKQTTLNSLGVTELLAVLISSLDSTADGDLPDVAIDLLIEMMNGGNETVARELYQFLVDVDTDGKFMKHLDRRFDADFEALQATKEKDQFGSGAAVINPEVVRLCDNVGTTVRLLQLCCEGHNLPFQDLMRAQPMYTGDINLVAQVAELLALLCDSSVAVARFRRQELELISQLLATLVELIQGPCPGNQETIVASDAIAAVNSILPALNDHDRLISDNDPAYMEIRGQACVLYVLVCVRLTVLFRPICVG